MNLISTKNKNSIIYVSIIASTISILIFSSCSVCNNHLRNSNVDDDIAFDFLGEIVGVLSILVTVLIGWNIYNALGIDTRTKKIEEKNRNIIRDTEDALVKIQQKTKNALEETERRRLSTEEYCIGCIDFIQGFTLLNDDSDKRYLQKYMMFTSAIFHFLKSGEQISENIETCLKNMEDCLNLIKNNPDSDYTIDKEDIFNNMINEIIESKSIEFNAKLRRKFSKIDDMRIKLFSSNNNKNNN